MTKGIDILTKAFIAFVISWFIYILINNFAKLFIKEVLFFIYIFISVFLFIYIKKYNSLEQNETSKFCDDIKINDEILSKIKILDVEHVDLEHHVLGIVKAKETNKELAKISLLKEANSLGANAIIMKHQKVFIDKTILSEKIFFIVAIAIKTKN